MLHRIAHAKCRRSVGYVDRLLGLNVDDAYGKSKSNYASLFITEVIHEVEEEELFYELRKTDGGKETIDMLFS